MIVYGQNDHNVLKLLKLMKTAITIVLCAFAALSAFGQDGIDCYWTNPDGGEFHNPDNWQDGNVPGENDAARFEIGDTYEVWFESSATNASKRILDGDVTFNLKGHRWEASSILHVTDGGCAFFYSDTPGAMMISQRPAGGGDESVLVIGANVTYDTLGGWGTSLVFGGWDSTFRLQDGAHMTWNGTLYPRHTAAATGFYHVTGPGTLMTCAGNFRFRAGTYTLLVDHEATVDVGYVYSDSTNANHTFIIDNATLIQEGSTFYVGHQGKGHMFIRNGGIHTNDSTSVFYIARYSVAEGTLTIESGGRMVKTAGTIAIADSTGEGTIILRDPDSELRQRSLLRIGNSGAGRGTILVHTGALMRVENDIYQLAAESTASIEVRGAAGPAHEERARIEAGNLLVGADRDAETTGTGSLTVGDGGRIEVAAEIHSTGTGGLLHIGSRSTLAMDGGLIEADEFELEVNGADTAKLSVSLHAGGTGAQITVDGTASVGDAEFELDLADGFASVQDETFTVIAAGTLTGKFNGINEGEVISVGDYYQFRASYEDNSFTLTTMPPKGTVLMLF